MTTGEINPIEVYTQVSAALKLTEKLIDLGDTETDLRTVLLINGRLANALRELNKPT